MNALSAGAAKRRQQHRGPILHRPYQRRDRRHDSHHTRRDQAFRRDESASQASGRALLTSTHFERSDHLLEARVRGSEKVRAQDSGGSGRGPTARARVGSPSARGAVAFVTKLRGESLIFSGPPTLALHGSLGGVREFREARPTINLQKTLSGTSTGASVVVDGPAQPVLRLAWAGGSKKTLTRRDPHRGHLSRSAIRGKVMSLPRVQTSDAMSCSADATHSRMDFMPSRLP